MNRLSLRNNRLKEVQDYCMKAITGHFRGIYRIIYPNLIKENRLWSTRNRLDLQTIRISTGGYAQKSPRSLI